MGKSEIGIESMMAVLEEEGEEPLAKCSAYTYTRVVQEHFEIICSMKQKRFSYIQIWKALKKLNVLPEYSNAHSFRQAFNREWKRQKGEESLKSFLKANLRQMRNFRNRPTLYLNPDRLFPPNRRRKKATAQTRRRSKWKEEKSLGLAGAYQRRAVASPERLMTVLNSECRRRIFNNA